MNIVAVGVECFAEVVINVQRIGVGSIGHDIHVGVGQRKLVKDVDVVIVGIPSGACCRAGLIDDVFQAVAIAVSRSINQGLRLVVTRFVGVRSSVVVTVGVQIVGS